jgi:hypothetical protein
VVETGSGGQCADRKALDGASSVAVSADGMSLYVASQVSDAVAAFARASSASTRRTIDRSGGKGLQRSFEKVPSA